jgi:hypothetical protein
MHLRDIVTISKSRPSFLPQSYTKTTAYPTSQHVAAMADTTFTTKKIILKSSSDWPEWHKQLLQYLDTAKARSLIELNNKTCDTADDVHAGTILDPVVVAFQAKPVKPTFTAAEKKNEDPAMLAIIMQERWNNYREDKEAYFRNEKKIAHLQEFLFATVSPMIKNAPWFEATITPSKTLAILKSKYYPQGQMLESILQQEWNELRTQQNNMPLENWIMVLQSLQSRAAVADTGFHKYMAV